MPSRGPKIARHGRTTPAARWIRCEVKSRPTSESAVSSATTPSLCSRRAAQVSHGRPRSACGPVCAAETSRHSEAQPRASAASSSTRGRSSSSHVPPCAGDRRDDSAPLSTALPVPVTGLVSSIARSTPRTGLIPADWQASIHRTAPYRPSRSVSPTIGLAELGGPLGDGQRGGGAVLQGVAGGHVQMAEGHGRSSGRKGAEDGDSACHRNAESPPRSDGSGRRWRATSRRAAERCPSTTGAGRRGPRRRGRGRCPRPGRGHRPRDGRRCRARPRRRLACVRPAAKNAAHSPSSGRDLGQDHPDAAAPANAGWTGRLRAARTAAAARRAARCAAA